jgi:hypothetical protein
MSKEEYAKAIEEETKAHENRLKLIQKEYAFSNNTVKEGDIVEDRNGKIKVEKIFYSSGYLRGFPCCVYRGVELKKDGTPTKKGDKRDVWQTNLKLNT